MSHFRTIIVHNAVYTNMDYLRFKDTLFQSQFDKMQSLVAPWKYLNAVLTCATSTGLIFKRIIFRVDSFSRIEKCLLFRVTYFPRSLICIFFFSYFNLGGRKTHCKIILTCKKSKYNP